MRWPSIEEHGKRKGRSATPQKGTLRPWNRLRYCPV